MKVCAICGEEIATRDGENTCQSCEEIIDAGKTAKINRARNARRERDAALQSLGLTKVRGAMGGTYWE